MGPSISIGPPRERLERTFCRCGKMLGRYTLCIGRRRTLNTIRLPYTSNNEIIRESEKIQLISNVLTPATYVKVLFTHSDDRHAILHNLKCARFVSHVNHHRQTRVYLRSVMLSGILIFNQKGENLIFRAFRNDCRPRLADVFRIQVISNAQVRSPILTLGSTTFSHVKHENIYLVAVTKSNANAALVFEFLYRLVALGKGYFGKFDEEAVKNNFVLVYELLDGMIYIYLFLAARQSHYCPIYLPAQTH